MLSTGYVENCTCDSESMQYVGKHEKGIKQIYALLACMYILPCVCACMCICVYKEICFRCQTDPELTLLLHVVGSSSPLR